MVLGFLIKRGQPFMTAIDRDHETRLTTTIFLEPVVPEPGVDSKNWERAAAYEWGWNNRSEWERLNPSHPFNWMRRALEGRDWIVRNVVHGSAVPRSGHTPADYVATDDLFLASTLVALAVPMKAYQGRSFYFDSRARQTQAIYGRETGEEPAQWMKKVLFQQEELMRCIQAAQRHHSHLGDRRVIHSTGRRGNLFIPVNMPPGPRRMLENDFSR
jgi:hypothetical protein